MTIKITVGTVPVLLLRPNPYRTGYRIFMPTTTLYAANTGRIHIGLGFVPLPEPDSPACGVIITQGTALEAYEAYPNDPSVYKGEIYAVASTSNQVLWIDEFIRVPEGEAG